MKYINLKTFLFIAFVLFSAKMNAQEDTVATKQIELAFRAINEKDLLGGISSLNVSELMEKDYHYNAGETFSDFLPGLTGNMWGISGYLTLVDGVPRDLGNILPSEIEQITALKGASAIALYGSLASKGVLLITTKRGVAGQNTFKVRANTGIAVPTIYPEYLGAAEYMTLYNEARTNDGLMLLYSDEAIYNHASGSNPYRYPDVDYYSSDYLKKFSNRSDVIAEFKGGNERARFYANMGFYNSNSLLNVGTGKDESVNRFNVRGNVDIELNKFITGKINTSMMFYDTKTANGDYWSNAASLRPNWYTPLIPVDYLEKTDEASWQYANDSPFLIDGKYLLGGRQDMLTTPFAEMYTKGAIEYAARYFQSDASINFDLSPLLKGLAFNTQFGIDYLSRYTLDVDVNTYAVYGAAWNNHAGYDQINSLTKWNEDKVSRTRDLHDSYQRQMTFFSAQFNYNNTFNDAHNLSAILLAHGYQRTVSATYHKESNANLGLQAGYNYRQKYYFDFTGNIVHSAKLAPGHREAFSPTVSLGWRIGRENFLAGADFIDDLKLTASAGILNTDLDISDYFMYKSIYAQTGGYYRWSEIVGANTEARGTDVQREANLNLGFVKRKEINLGLEAALFNKSLQLNASYFNITMDGIPIQNTIAYPSYMTYSNIGSTSFIAYENYDADQYKGFDFGVSLNKRISKVDLSLGVVGTYYDATAKKRSENYQYDYQTRTGKPTDGIWGLKSDGFFMNEADIAGHVTQTFGEVKPGDMKYIDQNGDEKIDDNDVVYLGRSSAPFVMGLNFTAKWKQFTLFALANGQFGGYGMKSGDYYRVRQERKYSAVVRDRTIIEKNGSGEWEVTKLGSYPRLTAGSGDNNFRDSDYWLYKTDRFNIAKVQLSYDIPKHLFRRTFIDDLGVYVAGYNLLTIAKERKILETAIGSAPQTRLFNVGLKATF
jgi:TonB-linked SusC/RagA family outer membrane protein